MKIEYLTPLKPEFFIEPNGEDHWRLFEPFALRVDDREWTIPKGFWTDFASIPRALWAAISPYDLGVGCIPHDWGYRTKTGNKAYWDLVFLSCMERDKIALWKRQAAFYAVKWFGQAAWDKQPPAVEARADLKRALRGEMNPKALAWQDFVKAATVKGGAI